ncbi:DUF1120 domain-containing protein [Herbaspirillum lusitanum]|uniref:DUF1120 domain-containing protein n=1 Tax=Herbaspirillum lusitanum TaxID=213312 RepID=A0ABW9A278_9BURK
MKNLITASALLAVALFSTLSHAADTAELKVKGVIRPSACVPSFSGGAVVDYGVIPASVLKKGAYTPMPTREVALNIKCEAPTKIGFKFVDNRHESIVTEMMQYPEHNFGLGTVGGKKTGGYTIEMAGVTGDGVAGQVLYSGDSGKSWYQGASGLNTWHLFSFNNGGWNPGAYKDVTAKIRVAAIINKPEDLDLTREIPLDGSATIEVIYL